MARSEADEEREHRIAMEIVVDAYDEHERAMGWYYYLHDHLGFPFRARCVHAREVSPLRKDEEVEVIGMPKEEECPCDMFATILWERRELAVPLSQLEALSADEDTTRAVEDWRYWKRRGYMF